MIFAAKARKSIVLAGVIALLLFACTVALKNHLDWRLQLANVLVGDHPVIATNDLATLRAISLNAGTTAGTEKSPDLTLITRQTRCTILRWETEKSCPSNSGIGTNPIQVKLLEGPNSGRIVWVCANDVRRSLICLDDSRRGGRLLVWAK